MLNRSKTPALPRWHSRTLPAPRWHRDRAAAAARALGLHSFVNHTLRYYGSLGTGAVLALLHKQARAAALDAARAPWTYIAPDDLGVPSLPAATVAACPTNGPPASG